MKHNIYPDFKVVLVNPDNRQGFQLITVVHAYNEDKAMEIALRKYAGLEVYDVQEV